MAKMTKCKPDISWCVETWLSYTDFGRHYVAVTNTLKTTLE